MIRKLCINRYPSTGLARCTDQSFADCNDSNGILVRHFWSTIQEKVCHLPHKRHKIIRLNFCTECAT